MMQEQNQNTPRPKPSRCGKEDPPTKDCCGKYPKPCVRCYLDDIAPFFDECGHYQREIDCARKHLCKIKHVLLRIPRVSAVDVGFLYCYKECKYLPKVGIRIHFEAQKDKCCEIPVGWLRIPYKLLQEIWCLLELQGRPRAINKCSKEHQEIDIESLRDKQHLDTDFCICFRRCKDKEGEPVLDREGKPINVVVDFVPASYQAATHDVRTEQPLPNTEGFGDEASERLGRYPVEPLVGGISVGNAQGSAGTLGLVVWDSKDGKPCILSNWHVLSGVPGSRLGEPVYQPALFDGGRPEEDRVGFLKRWLFNPHGDAALAQIEKGVDYAPGEILGLWLPIWDAVTPKLGMEVRKWGRASRFTKGFIDGIDMAVKVEYSNVGIRQYDCQFRIAPTCAGQEVSSPGDSGAIWVAMAELEWKDRHLFDLFQKDTGLTQHLQARKSVKMPELGRHIEQGHEHPQQRKLCEPSGKKLRVYFGVCLQFAGDVPGSSLREHAVGSSLIDIGKRLHFSLRPVFPHPDDIVTQPDPRQARAVSGSRGTPTFQISTDVEPRAVGPQPDPDPLTGHP